MLTDEGLALILEFEVGGGKEYYNKFLSRPTWPGYSSGVTIGIGWDCGYNTIPQLHEAWGGVLCDSSISALSLAIGKTGISASEYLKSSALREIEVPWEKALAVFLRVTIPAFYLKTLRAYPQAEYLPDQCRDALISLVFNRGTDMNGERRIEMAQIRNCLRENRISDIPATIRSMKRLWPDARNPDKETGLQRRRSAEASLFERFMKNGTRNRI